MAAIGAITLTGTPQNVGTTLTGLQEGTNYVLQAQLGDARIEIATSAPSASSATSTIVHPELPWKFNIHTGENLWAWTHGRSHIVITPEVA